jgi:hypothetical protein
MRELKAKSLARLTNTKKLKLEWREELNRLEAKDVFKLDYSIPKEILLGKILRNVDAKSKSKSNVLLILIIFSGIYTKRD